MDRRCRKPRGAGPRSQDERTHRSSLIQADSFEAEVRGFHAFFERWYSGAADPNETSRLDVLADSFVMIGPDRGSSNVDEIRALVEAAHGCRPTEFRIRNVVTLPDAPVGTYEEWQAADSVTTGDLKGQTSARSVGSDR